MQPARGGAGRRVSPALLDGEPVDVERAALPLDSAGGLLGDSVFETMRAYAGRPFRLEGHLERLERSAEWARMRLGAPREAVAGECARVAAAVAGDSAVRVFVLRGGRGPGALGDRPTRRLVFAEPVVVDRADYVRGVSACVLPAARFGTAEAPHAKYARYLPRLLARDEARTRGAGEALLADETGRIVEAATASVGCVVRGALVTSSVLPSITRDAVVELARERGIACADRPIEPGELAQASELFVASSLRELVPVVRVDGRAVGVGAPGEVTRALHAALRALAGAEGPAPWEPT
jgi:branched-subunit amino acid aminotransferase/4-amino-4-deoxychorismate lyase